MSTIRAIFENGVFRPMEKVDLPERTEVEFAPHVIGLPTPTDEELAQLYKILQSSDETGDVDLAARHNEHQP